MHSSGSLGDGIEMVQALDETHAVDIVRAQHPDAQVKVVPAVYPVGVGALAPRQSGELPEELAAAVIGLHVFIAVIHQQVGIARFDRCRLLRTGHTGFF